MGRCSLTLAVTTCPCRLIQSPQQPYIAHVVILGLNLLVADVWGLRLLLGLDRFLPKRKQNQDSAAAMTLYANPSWLPAVEGAITGVAGVTLQGAAAGAYNRAQAVAEAREEITPTLEMTPSAASSSLAAASSTPGVDAAASAPDHDSTPKRTSYLQAQYITRLESGLTIVAPKKRASQQRTVAASAAPLGTNAESPPSAIASNVSESKAFPSNHAEDAATWSRMKIGGSHLAVSVWSQRLLKWMPDVCEEGLAFRFPAWLVACLLLSLYCCIYMFVAALSQAQQFRSVKQSVVV